MLKPSTVVYMQVTPESSYHPYYYYISLSRIAVVIMASLLSPTPSSIMMPSSPSMQRKLLLTGAAVSVSFLIFLLFNKLTKRPPASKPLRLPPGPKGWPIVGNLLQVALSGKQFIHYVRDARLLYGPIFTLRMGSRTMIVVSSPELAHEALITKGQQFASRPPETPTRAVFSSDKFTVNSAPYGATWRSLRRNMASGMLSSARMREFRPARESAMDRFIDRIRAEADANDGAVWVLKNARFAVFRILLAMCFGVHLDEDSIVRFEQLMKKVLIALTPRMDDFLPILRPLFAKQFKQALHVRDEQVAAVVQLIRKRRSILQNPGLDPDAIPFSYLDSLLGLAVDGRASAPTDVELVSLCSEFINGGTDTTATAVEWAFARLLDDPSIQPRLYGEIAAAVGDRAVEETDTEEMPYLQAFVKELLRKHPPTHFLLTHAAAEPGAKLGGYDVPAGANLEIYSPAISEDPALWAHPGRFDPDRFLTGGEGADLTGVTGVRMVPFGAGRRVCPGLAMGMTHITLMVARMVQAFEWRAHPSQPVMDFSDKFEFTVVMNRPLLAVVRPRTSP